LPPLGTQTFSATVLGTTNQSVMWQIQGSACGTTGACGTIDSPGDYTAPGTAPNTLQVVATSEYDSRQSATANVAIST
jgi:hypothetical protein